ncbi:MAG TPA: hypothetical protein VM492_07280 [Sumerlaeia bacterium]|nr:hypothetical protein [Sumerlaeia bacterium]
MMIVRPSPKIHSSTKRPWGLSAPLRRYDRRALVGGRVLLALSMAAAPGIASTLGIAAMLAVSPARCAAQSAGLTAQGLFRPGGLIRLALPEEADGVGEAGGAGEAEGRWVIVDDRCRAIRNGVLKPGERALYLGDLGVGGYFLFWGLEEGDARLRGANPRVDMGPRKRLCFFVLPESDRSVTDDFFAVNQPGMARAAREGRTGPDSDYAFVLSATARLGTRRLRTELERSIVLGSGEEYDWQAFDRLVSDMAANGIRLVAQMGDGHNGGSSSEPSPAIPPGPGQEGTTLSRTADSRPAPGSGEASALRGEAYAGATSRDFARDLLRRFGFKLDQFVLGGEIGGEVPRLASVHDFTARIGPVHTMVKTRSPKAWVMLGGLAPGPDGVTFAAGERFLRALFNEGVGSFGVIDHRADGPLFDVRRLTSALDDLLRGTGSENKPRAVSSAAVSSGKDSVEDQRRQAAETIEKLVWFRHRGYLQFAVSRLLDTETRLGEGGAGLFSRPSGSGERPPEPRLLALAWAHAVQRLAGSRPVEDLGFASETIESYAFSRRRETVLAVWMPKRSDKRPSEERIAAAFSWPDDAKAEIYDLLGHAVTGERLRRQGKEQFFVLVDLEPAYIVVDARADQVGW